MFTLLLALLATSAVSPRAAIATAHPLASEAGVEQLRAGGNAADAAAAAAFALSVVEQQSSGIGGGGFALVYLAKENRIHVLDFRETAPAAASKDMYLHEGKPQPELSLTGGLSVAVPGAVKGYVELVRRFGKRPLAKVMGPAISLAAEGFRTGISNFRAAQARLEPLRKDPGARAAILVEGKPPEPGHLWAQRDLAATLKAIAGDGGDGFYRGALARKLVEGVRAAGGILTLEDLQRYRVRERAPIEGRYRGHRVVSMPPPSAGGAILVALLQALEGEDPRAGGYRPERFVHAMVEIEKRLFARRTALFGDPDFFKPVAAAVREMIDPAFAAVLRAQIGEKATPAAEVKVKRESGSTTHLSVVDEEGNAVALTTTVNYIFGSCVVPPGTGVVMNDHMDDFDLAPGVPNVYGLVGAEANSIAPGKVPLSSMSPTLVFAPDGRLRMVVGSPGGSTIPTTVAQTILHVIDDGMPIDAALAAPRIHHQLHPDELRVEADGIEAATAAALRARGHRIVFGWGSERAWGNAQAVSVDPKNGWRAAASDPRGSGAGAVP